MMEIKVEQCKPVRFNLRDNWPLYAMILPGVVLLFLFCYLPMGGIVMAFQNFKATRGFFGSQFVGLKWFRYLLNMPDAYLILRNTLVIALQKIVFTQIVSLMFALLLNEIRNVRLMRTIQTVVYLPHFLSWVVAGGIFADLFALNGVINRMIVALGGKEIFFLGSNRWFQPLLILTHIWKGFGWGAILYLAALTGVNPEYYESAIIDGANRLDQAWYITLPCIMPTIVLVATLALGGVLNAGFEQVYQLYSPVVYETGDIIDTFVYRVGLIQTNFSLGSATGLLKSAVSSALIILSYKLADAFAGYRIF